MIARVRGLLEALGPDHAIVAVGGISLRVFAPTSTLGAIGAVGDEVRLHTHLHVREEELSLYGFATEAERDLFRRLIGVSGVGPRVALALLSTLEAAALVAAIAGGATEQLRRVPGVGERMANRLVVELKGKLPPLGEGALPGRAPIGDADVALALAALGYSAAEIAEATAELPTSGDIEERLRAALQRLAR